jgi:hypothetical protein
MLIIFRKEITYLSKLRGCSTKLSESLREASIVDKKIDIPHLSKLRACSTKLSESLREASVVERRERDSNPRNPCELNGFQDRRIRPLCHLSVGKSNL